MACGEFGPGRLPEPPAVAEQICAMLGQTFNAALTAGRSPTTVPSAAPLAAQPDFADINHLPLFGKRVLVTAGPTHEAIDPVRYIANRSSGRQGFAIAAAAADLGAEVTLIAGPVHLETPPGVIRINVETALEMQAEVEKALPVDAAIMVAAVADWRAAQAPDQKIKKDGDAIPALVLTENPDILASLATHKHRPKLLIGFAAETEKIRAHAQAKLAKKGCDWIVANDVSGDVMGGALCIERRFARRRRRGAHHCRSRRHLRHPRPAGRREEARRRGALAAGEPAPQEVWSWHGPPQHAHAPAGPRRLRRPLQRAVSASL
jgi:phosphopantothenoylcysteine decarboxylase/phosphopantothenate--cysteine ligase